MKIEKFFYRIEGKIVEILSNRRRRTEPEWSNPRTDHRRTRPYSTTDGPIFFISLTLPLLIRKERMWRSSDRRPPMGTIRYKVLLLTIGLFSAVAVCIALQLAGRRPSIIIYIFFFGGDETRTDGKAFTVRRRYGNRRGDGTTQESTSRRIVRAEWNSAEKLIRTYKKRIKKKTADTRTRTSASAHTRN